MKIVEIKENFRGFHAYMLILLIGVLFGILYLKINKPIFIIAPLLPLAGLVLFLKPEWGILIILIITSSIINIYSLPYFSVGFGSFHITDLILLFLLGVVVYRILLQQKFRSTKTPTKTPLDLPLILFMVAGIISFFIATIKYSVSPNDAMKQLRGLSYYSLFFVVTCLIHERKQIKFLLICILTIGSIASLAIIMASLFGIEIPGYQVQLQEDMTISRLIPPGFRIVYYSFVISLVYLLMRLSKKEFKIFLPILILTGLGILFSFNRTSWISLTFCTMLAFVFSPFKYKMKFFLVSINLIVTIIISSYFLFPHALDNRYTKAIVERAESIFRGEKTIRLDTLQDRKEEISYAFEKIRKSPFLGIGLRNTYRPPSWEGDNLTYFIHNSYVGILKDMGIIGLIPFLILSFQHVARGFRNWKRIEDESLSCLCLGITIAYAGTLISSFTEGTHYGGWTVAIFGITWGINEVIIKNNIKHSTYSQKISG